MSLKKLLLLLLVVNIGASAQDYGQTMPGQLDEKDSPYADSNYKNNDEAFPDIIGGIPQQYTEEELKDAQMSEQDKEWLKTTSEEGSILIDPSPNGYVEYRSQDQVKDYYQKSDSQIGFSYFYDTYDYSDTTGVFQRTFNSENPASKSLQAGYLTLNYKHYIQRNIVSTFFQGNLGASYNSGFASFADGSSVSKTKFALWLFPIDLNIGAKINMGRSIALSFQGGPTIAPIWQNRDDRVDGEDGKDVKQVGYGYNASASVDFSIFNMFPGFGMDLKRSSEVTDMSISLIARTMSISGFKKEDFEVSGASFGIGFNFEYL